MRRLYIHRRLSDSLMSFGVVFEREAATRTKLSTAVTELGSQCGCEAAAMLYEAALDEYPRYSRSSGYFLSIQFLDYRTDAAMMRELFACGLLFLLSSVGTLEH